jgi:hypothetical protein
MSEWISVKDDLPKDYEPVIAATSDKKVIPDAYYDKKFGWQWECNDYLDGLTVTHWMELPAHPEGEL